jgi:hypothetical protein
MRVTLHPQAREAFGLLGLPWHESLEHWTDPRLVAPRDEGLHRHVVRFVEGGGRLWAIKELPEPLADREYRVLSRLGELGILCVPVYGVVAERAPGVEAALITGFLEYSSTYRAVFTGPRGPHSRDRLIDALAQLLARLHLAGVYWGDCSLSNTLFRPDAGSIGAYLVDAETAELHPSLSEGQRRFDIEYAAERVGGELFDLRYGGLLPEDVDPVEIAAELPRRYQALWDELTREELLRPDEQRYRVAERVDRINELGFDVDEIELITTDDGVRLRVRTQVAETGRHRNQLFVLTGLQVTENQARRLLNDLRSYRGYLEQKEGRAVPETVAGHRWRAEQFDRVMALVPEELADRLEPAEVFHEILEHRWFLSEQAGKDVGTTAAAKSYITRILPQTPSTLTVLPGADAPGVDAGAEAPTG